MNMESLKAVGASSVHVAVLLGFARRQIAQKPVSIAFLPLSPTEVRSKECGGVQRAPTTTAARGEGGGGAADLAQTLLILANTSL